MASPRKCHCGGPRSTDTSDGHGFYSQAQAVAIIQFMPGLRLFARQTSEELLSFLDLYFAVPNLISCCVMLVYKLLLHSMNYNACKHFFSCRQLSEFSFILEIATNARLLSICRGVCTLETLFFPFWRGSLYATLCGGAAQTLGPLSAYSVSHMVH